MTNGNGEAIKKNSKKRTNKSENGAGACEIGRSKTWEENINDILQSNKLLFKFKDRIFQSKSPTHNHYIQFLQRFGKNSVDFTDSYSFSNRGYITEKQNARQWNKNNFILKFSPHHSIKCPDLSYIQAHQKLNPLDLLDNFFTSNEFPESIAHYIIAQSHMILKSNKIFLTCENISLEECFYLLLKVTKAKIMEHDFLQKNCPTYLSMILKDLIIIPEKHSQTVNRLMGILNLNVPIIMEPEPCGDYAWYKHDGPPADFDLIQTDLNTLISYSDGNINAINWLYKLHTKVVSEDNVKDPFIHAIFEYAVIMTGIYFTSDNDKKKLLNTYIALCIWTKILYHPSDIVAFDNNIQLSSGDIIEILNIVIKKHPYECQPFNNFCHFIADNPLKAYGLLSQRLELSQKWNLI